MKEEEEEEYSCKRRKSIAGEKIMKRPKQKGEESTKYSMISMLQDVQNSRLKHVRCMYKEYTGLQGLTEVIHYQK